MIKNTLRRIASLSLAAALAAAGLPSAAADSALKGDVNLDGQVSPRTRCS